MKLQYQVKYEVQSNVINVEIANTSAGLKSANVIDLQLSGFKLFDTITPKQIGEYQKRDNQLLVVYEFVANNHKPKLSEIHCILSKPIRHLLLQFDCLSIMWRVLHHQTFWDNDEIQQLILPVILHDKILKKSLHDDNGHQGLHCFLDLLCYKA